MQSQRAWLFDGLSDEELGPELERLERRSYPAGSILLRQGDGPSEMYFIRSGHVEIYTGRDEQDFHVRRVGPGGTVGDMSLLSGQPVSATVRATTNLEVLVLSREDFDHLTRIFPRIYPNVIRVLSERLASTTRRSERSPARVSLLLDCDAPPLLGHALACSVAWHTRRPTLLLVVPEGAAAPELADRAARDGDHGQGGVADLLEHARAYADRNPYAEDALTAQEAGAHLRLLEPGGPFPHEDLLIAVEDLAEYYQNILIQVPGDRPPRGLKAPAVVLSCSPTLPAGMEGARYAICAWREPEGPARPERDRVLFVPAVGAADDDALSHGILPATTPAGRALGWAARDLSGLKVGLALGGGTEKGYAHLGVLRVLERHGIDVDYVAGASIGSAIAAAYGQGYSTDEIAKMMDDLGPAICHPTIPIASFLSNTRLRLHLKRLIGQARIEDLRVPMAVVAADLEARREVVFRRGLLYPALLASMAVPGFYPAQSIGPYSLVDGAVLNPVPSNVAAQMGADRVIAVKLRTPLDPIEWNAESMEALFQSPRLAGVVFRSFEMMQSKIAAETAEGHGAILIQPNVPDLPNVGFGALRNFHLGRRYIENGEEAAEAAMDRIAAALPWLNP